MLTDDPTWKNLKKPKRIQWLATCDALSLRNEGLSALFLVEVESALASLSKDWFALTSHPA